MKIIKGKDKSFITAEEYRNIRTNIEFSNIDRKKNIILLTSTQPDEGKTTVICNLAEVFAKLEHTKVLLIDGDLRNPSVHKQFSISNRIGLTDILLGNSSFEECVRKVDSVNFEILSCGQVPPNPSEILGSQKMKDFINSLKDKYDYIFIDSPPVGVVTDASIISTYSDGVIMIIGWEEVSLDSVKTAKNRLEMVNANILGTIVNKYRSKELDSINYYNYYYGKDKKIKRKHKKINSVELNVN